MPPVKKHLPECRWDKCDLNSYCITSGDLLSRLGHNFNCANGTRSCSDASCRVDIEIYYSEIVHCLLTASYMCVPQIPASALKHYWSPILDM